VTKTELFDSDVIVIGVHDAEVQSEQKAGARRTRSLRRARRSMDETMVMPPRTKEDHQRPDKTIPEPLGGFVVLPGLPTRREYELKERVSAIGKEKGAPSSLRIFCPQAVPRW
jgi:hypothetical protein